MSVLAVAPSTRHSHQQALFESSPRSIMSLKNMPTSTSQGMCRVTFDKSSYVQRCITHRLDLAQEEIDATWYSSVELKTMKRGLVPTVRKMAKNMPLDKEEEARGLEHKTPRGMRARQQNRFVSIDTVLDEQDRQFEEHRSDPRFLAEVYRQSSAHCTISAYKAAKGDEAFVEKHIRQDQLVRDLLTRSISPSKSAIKTSIVKGSRKRAHRARKQGLQSIMEN